MDQINLKDALTYSKWAVALAMLMPLRLVAIFAAANLIASAMKQRPFRKQLWEPHHWLFLTHTLFFVVAIVVSLLYSSHPSPAGHAANVWVFALLGGSITSCIFWVWQMKGFRWFAASLMALLEVFTLGAIFIAGMSISNDWL